MSIELQKNSPRVSVIIPVYNGIDHLAETIQSVLNQTYQDFEVVIVDDASADRASDVIGSFDDNRIKYIEHRENRGADAARNTGIRASSGEILAFLDQDDIFHPHKLQEHVDFLEKHPYIGFTYNARFELNHSANTIREIWQPPEKMTLADIVLSHQLSPSEMVIRRDWAFQVGLWDEGHPFTGSEIILLGHLCLAGCKFAGIPRVLNYRRYYSGRIVNELAKKCVSEKEAREKIFSAPRCPDEVSSLRKTSLANNSLSFAYLAFAQDETDLGREFLRESICFRPELIEGSPCELIRVFTHNSIADESVNHEALLKKIVSQFPFELAWLSEQCKWAAAHGYLLKGTRAIIWGRDIDGYGFLSKAVKLRAKMDQILIQTITAKLLQYESEFGSDSARDVIRNLSSYMDKIGYRSGIRRLKGCYSINRAFNHYHAGQYSKVPGAVMRAIRNNPQYLANRGVLASLIRSIIRMVGRKFQHKPVQGDLATIQDQMG